MEEIIVGSRGSDLAITQTRLVIKELADKFPDYSFKLKEISTKGDRILDRPLKEIGGKGLFIKEIEVALFNEEIDFAVHSLKDMPADLPEGLEILAIPKRTNPLDVLISKDDLSLDELPQAAKIGTGSLRRKSQLLNYRADLEVIPIRGNINTRLKKLLEQDLDGIILAAAGLERMGWEDKISQYLKPNISIPAAGQGALAIETRADDKEIKKLVKAVNHQITVDRIKAERSFLEYLDGDCKVPIGAYAEVEDEELRIMGMVGSLDGSRLIKAQIKGTRVKAEELGVNLAKKLTTQGARKLLEQVKRGKKQ